MHKAFLCNWPEFDRQRLTSAVVTYNLLPFELVEFYEPTFLVAVRSAMKFVSTRGGSEQATFEDTLFSGYCQDGGLFVPETVPVISKPTLREWSKLSFVELAQAIARLYIDEDEISTDDLNGKLITSMSLIGKAKLSVQMEVSCYIVVRLM